MSSFISFSSYFSIRNSCVIFLILFFYTFDSANGIKCWSCRSDTDPKCADPFDNKTLPIYDCNEVKFTNPLIDKQAVPTMCRKIRQKVKGKWSTIRSCALLGEPGEGTGNEHHCLIRHGTHDIFMEYCTCNSKDGCNGAFNLKSFSFANLLLLTLLNLAMFRR